MEGERWEVVPMVSVRPKAVELEINSRENEDTKEFSGLAICQVKFKSRLIY